MGPHNKIMKLPPSTAGKPPSGGEGYSERRLGEMRSRIQAEIRPVESPLIPWEGWRWPHQEGGRGQNAMHDAAGASGSAGCGDGPGDWERNRTVRCPKPPVAIPASVCVRVVVVSIAVAIGVPHGVLATAGGGGWRKKGGGEECSWRSIRVGPGWRGAVGVGTITHVSRSGRSRQ